MTQPLRLPLLPPRSGVAALSHKSHHRNDKEYPEPQGYADFERGHRDGLYNHPYDTYSRSDAYSDGYRSGVDEREQQSTCRSNPYAGSYRGGNCGGGGSDPVDVSDLVGSRAAGAQTELQSRGFRSVDSFESGNDKGTVWWNGRTRQCLQMITADGRADSITDVRTHPRCRWVYTGQTEPGRRPRPTSVSAAAGPRTADTPSINP